MTAVREPAGIVEHDLGDGVLRWELTNLARRNAIDPGALAWITRTTRRLSGQTVVLIGAGDQAFCAGFDLTSLDADRVGADPPDRPLIAATRAMSGADATFVGVINGYAIGAGVELACACDLLIARRDAWFQVPAGRLGVVYHAEGLARMRARFGPALTRRMVLLGDRIEAQEAEAHGAFVRCVAADQLEDTTRDLVTALRATAPLAQRGNRDLLRLLDAGSLQARDHARHERARAIAYGSEDHQEARRALAERRPPQFRGR
jgi:enoyl-CoA hydratase/carnithine racemase